jgi:hypothetical protein
MDSPTVNADFFFHLLNDVPEILDFPCAGSNLALKPPAPAISDTHTCVTGDVWVDDCETLAIGNLVEVGSSPDVSVGLTTAVQDHEQWRLSAVAVARRKAQLEKAISRARVPVPAEDPVGSRAVLDAFIKPRRGTNEIQESLDTTAQHLCRKDQSLPLCGQPTSHGLTKYASPAGVTVALDQWACSQSLPICNTLSTP